MTIEFQRWKAAIGARELSEPKDELHGSGRTPTVEKCTSRAVQLGEVATAKLTVDRVYKWRKTEVALYENEKGKKKLYRNALGFERRRDGRAR